MGVIVTADVNGRPWHTVRCLRCKKVFSVHWSLPYQRLPRCIKCRRRPLTVAERQVALPFKLTVADLT